MFFRSRSKHYPRLVEFIEHRVRERQAAGVQVGIAGAIIGTMAGLIGAGIGLTAGLGLLSLTSAQLIALILMLNVATWLAVGGFWFASRRRRRRRNADRKHQQAADAAIQQMAYSVHRRKLHKELDPIAGSLLEESARHFLRIRATLGSPFWTGADLPAHWKGLRDQALLASDQAMDELLVIFRDCMKRYTRQGSGVFELITDVVDELQGGRLRDADAPPAGFDQARQIAERLKLLATEVDQATGQVFRDETVADDFMASASIDVCLSELQTIRTAEDELRENLRN